MQESMQVVRKALNDIFRRPMTALEKIRMQTLQSMMAMERHHEAAKPVNLPFPVFFSLLLFLCLYGEAVRGLQTGLSSFAFFFFFSPLLLHPSLFLSLSLSFSLSLSLSRSLFFSS